VQQTKQHFSFKKKEFLPPYKKVSQWPNSTFIKYKFLHADPFFLKNKACYHRSDNTRINPNKKYTIPSRSTRRFLKDFEIIVNLSIK
jgi:hypothetical protein